MLGYLHWQFIAGPWWLLRLTYDLQRALAHFFSVSLMLRTLVAHWRRDATPYRGGTITNYVVTFAWNVISRGIGLVVRTIVLALWLVTAPVVFVLSLAVTLAFLTWPVLIIALALFGVRLIV